MNKLRYLGVMLAITLLLAACNAPASETLTNSEPVFPDAGAGVDGLALVDQQRNPTADDENYSESKDLDAESVTPLPTSFKEPLTLDSGLAEISTEIDWQSLPVIPEISTNALNIYRRGIQQGNDPHSFSILGECQSELAWEADGVRVEGFMAGFDDPANYTLGGKYAYLQSVIDYFAPSWTQERVAAHRGTNVAQVLSPLYSDPALCDVRESPLVCEIRRNNPSIIFISFETWFYDRPIASYETYTRQILDYAVEEGVLPVLVATPDSHAQSRDINAVLGKLAAEYDIPLWNYWAAVQPLPGNGLEPQPDANGFRHLTYGPNDFTDSDALQTAWTVRNLNGLQVLAALRQATETDSNN